MNRLFLFLYQYRAFFTFVAFEVVCVWMMVSSNHYQRALFFNSSGATVANINSFSYNIGEYFNLKETNVSLSEENARLRTLLGQKSTSVVSTISTESDSSVVQRWEFVSAKVVNNSVDRFTNFITIDKGEDAGIEVGMAVMSGNGAVGKVKATSDHYSVLTSILNIDVMTSAMLKRTGHFGTIQWDGSDPQYLDFNFIPPHVKPVVGDTVVTSGYNAIFPSGILIGIIEDVHLNEAALFYDLHVKIGQDFQKLNYVEVIKSKLKVEQDSVEMPFNPLVK